MVASTDALASQLLKKIKKKSKIFTESSHSHRTSGRFLDANFSKLSHNMGSEKKKIFEMTDRTSATARRIRPDELLAKYNIKREAYYARLRFLGIKARKDSSKRTYLTEDQVALLDALDAHIRKTGKMEGFEPNNGAALVKSASSDLETKTSEKIEPKSNPIPDSNQLVEFDRAAQSRAAEILLAAGEALTADYIANPDKLSPEFREKIFARSAGVPKLLDPAALAHQIASAAKGQSQKVGA